MGRLEEVREELERLVKEIEDDAQASRKPASLDDGMTPPIHICLQLFVPLDSPHNLHVELTINRKNDADDT
ncbi:hypothetical protein NE850_18940 [Paraburkholderia sp. USG1]|uniref:hypothetical protein n=1 Tax=Paraburkholderia sp. USG1 TaxID=2952268 RepID=UPI00285B415B|nr:hypothetical protein [Paraburkholderia sp. USG1]MDR8398420.1 hypothetical protein [Paraburkholderia sp. USG1]